MAKNNKKEVSKKNTTIKEEIYKIIKLLIIVLIIFGIFCMFTVYLTNRKENTTNNKSNNSSDINYEEVLAGSSFDLEDSNYVVIYYDMSDKDLKSNITTSINNYESKKDSKVVYVVDMSNKLNKNYLGAGNSVAPTSIDELSIKEPTLIEFSNNKVTKYITGSDNVKKYLD